MADTTFPDPTQAAADLWDDLRDHYPGTAAALTVHLQNLPADWPQRLFSVGRPDTAMALPPTSHGTVNADMPPEVAPYSDTNADTCPACVEAADRTEEPCRFHAGYATAHHEALQAQLDAVKADPTITLKDFLQRQADTDEEN